MPRRTLHEEAESEPFLVDDGTGTAYVDPSNARLVLSSDDETTVAGGDDPPAFVREYLEGVTSLDAVRSRRRWYVESRLDVDGEVRVVGRVDPDEVPDSAQSATTAFVDAGDAPTFYVTDDPDFGLETQLLQQAAVYFLVAVVLYAVSYWLLFLG